MNGLTLVDVRVDIKNEIVDLISRRFDEQNVPFIEMLTTSILMIKDKYKDRPLYSELAVKWLFDAFMTSIDPMEASIVQILAHDNESYRLVDSLTKRYGNITKYRSVWSDLLFPHTFNKDILFEDKVCETVGLNMQIFIERLLKSMEHMFNYVVRENNIIIDELFLVTTIEDDEFEEFDDSLDLECEELVDKLPMFTSDVDEIEDPIIRNIFRNFEVKEFFNNINNQETLVHPPKYISISKILSSINLKLCRTLLKHLSMEERNLLIDYIHRNTVDKLQHVLNKFSNETKMVNQVIMAYIKSAVGVNNGDIFDNILHEIGGGTTEECIAVYNRHNEIYKRIQNDVHDAIKEISPRLLAPINDFFLAVIVENEDELEKVRNIFNDMVDELFDTKTHISKILNSNIVLRKIYESDDEEEEEKPASLFNDIIETKKFKTMLVSELYEILDRLDSETLELYYNTKLKYRRAVIEAYKKHGGNE